MSRRGFTLIELLLVLTIVVVAVSAAVPTYDAMIVSRRIYQAADTIQLALQRARLEAIRTGQAQVFRCQVGLNAYQVQPWLKASDEVEASAGATIVTQFGQALDTEAVGGAVTAQAADMTAGQLTLEDGIVFGDAQVLNDMRALSELTMADSMLSATTGWSQPIMFYPDGSSTTAQIIVQNPRGRRFAIQLRGLTGEVRVLDAPSVGG